MQPDVKYGASFREGNVAHLFFCPWLPNVCTLKNQRKIFVATLKVAFSREFDVNPF